jgi:antitoxin (DNA-binding transcriptional repressor) of toxin-antitoxin stability system
VRLLLLGDGHERRRRVEHRSRDAPRRRHGDDDTQGGEEITVTEHGRPIARLSPVGADVDRMTTLVDAGIVQPPTATARRLPAERVTLTGSGAIDDDVAQRR